MSGGIAQLVAVGAQDVHLVGQPEVSFFRSTYKRHTNFSQTVERQVIQGNVSNNGMSTIRFERKGDMLNYVYLMPIKSDGTQSNIVPDWTTAISKVELLVGGQVIDDQDSFYSTQIAPTLSATSSSKSVAGDLYGGSTNERFYPQRPTWRRKWPRGWGQSGSSRRNPDHQSPDHLREAPPWRWRWSSRGRCSIGCHRT